MPSIEASTEADALFALGFVHAQDRLWQLDFNRRIAQGRLAELIGPRGLDTDRFLRTLGIYRAAQAAAEELDPETRALVQAYVAGLNEALTNRAGPLPPEFLLTGAGAPQPWQVADTIAWALMMALDLSRSNRDELTRLRLAARFSKDEIEDFKPPYPGESRAHLADYPQMYRVLGLFGGSRAELLQQAQRLAQVDLSAALAMPEGLGSNNWVIGGSRTVSGKPLLANDPHLGLTTPSVWYFARIRAPGLDVFGATLPGIPYVLLGRNADVAWGFTNTGPDVQDFYIERLHPQDPERYQTPDGYARFERYTETIPVRGQQAVELVVRRTRHGPVLSGALPGMDKTLDGARYVLALRWAALEPGDTSLAAIRAMNRARNAAEFEAALSGFKLAMQNVVYADTAGNIGFVAAGRAPLRGPEDDLKGIAPAPGWDARYDWRGWIPFAELPRAFNPPEAMIVTANERITPPNYAHFLTTDWQLPYRAQRIRELLQATPRHDESSMRRIQQDVVSLAARDLLRALKALAPQPSSPAGRLAWQRLADWDGAMRADGPEPLLFHAWMRRLRARLFEDDLGDLAKDLVGNAELVATLLRVLSGQAVARDWCDDQTTRSTRETCAEVVTAALDESVAELARATGRDPLALRWSDAHRAIHEHRPLSNVKFLRDFFELQVPVGGDSFTVNAARLDLRDGADWRAPYTTRHGASLRAIYDLAPGRTGVWIGTTGQVGHPFAENYGDLLDSWRTGRYEPIPGARPRSDSTPPRVLILRPR
ncbi:MAG: penicillin acylase family protein [Sutterellaceae bacterium]|nr:penicillin acylase family protein [Burkholderiaceae bacterium]MDW8430094.1 penicillin acylase family protein [Sutterellaceae bacterium]